MEEANLDADARLPPRKRLLAGLKKQNGDGSSPSSPLLSMSTEMSNRLRDLLNNNLNGCNGLSEEIVDASRSAALAAAEVAAAAKAAAEEKAAVAVKAVAAAKTALELVAAFSAKKSRKDRGVWDDKTKKHVPVQVLYRKKRKRGDKNETDEELARKLHRVINSSPRILKSSSSSDPKFHNHRKHRKKLKFETATNSNGGGKLSYTPETKIDQDDTVRGGNMGQLEDKALECTKTDGLEMKSVHTNADAEAGHLTDQALEDSVRTNRKRGRIKQKKLSLSLCTVRDRENTKEDPKSSGSKSVQDPDVKASTTVDSLVTVEPSTEIEVSQEAASTRQRKEISTPQCYGGSNILRSLCSNPAVSTGSAMVEVDQ